MTSVYHDQAKHMTHFIPQDHIVCLLENLICRCARWITSFFVRGIIATVERAGGHAEVSMSCKERVNSGPLLCMTRFLDSWHSVVFTF